MNRNGILALSRLLLIRTRTTRNGSMKLAFVLSSALAACASAGTEITPESQELRFAHYSMALPPGCSLIEIDEASELAVAELLDSPTQFTIRVFLNTLVERDGKTQSSDDVANDYRDSEERIMLTEGVERGLYRLKDVVKTEEVHGGKVFHAMHYVVTTSAEVTSASLYLYFPDEDRVREFVVIHYARTIPTMWSWGTRVMPSDSADAGFLQTLASLSTNERADSPAQ
jgi:hypothetical protein